MTQSTHTHRYSWSYADTMNKRALSIADMVTLSRGVAASGLLAAGIHRGPPSSRSRWYVWLTLIYGAVVCDWLDGPLARRCGGTRMGGVLDLEADSLLTLCASIAAVNSGELPRLVSLPAIARYVLAARLLLAGRYAHLRSAEYSWSRPLGTIQMVTFVAALAPFKGRLTRVVLRLLAPSQAAVQLFATAHALISRPTRPWRWGLSAAIALIAVLRRVVRPTPSDSPADRSCTLTARPPAGAGGAIGAERSIRGEIYRWLAFGLFLTGIYGLRRLIDSAPDMRHGTSP